MSAPTAQTLRESLRPLTDDPDGAAIFCDIDGTLAPIVARPEQAHVREEISLLLGRLGRRYRCVACVSGRPVSEARRLVGVGSIAYAGAHGAVARQRAEMMDFARFARFDDQAGLHAQTLADQMMMHRRSRQQRRHVACAPDDRDLAFPLDPFGFQRLPDMEGGTVDHW